MTTLNKLEELDVVESGKALRKALREAFPGTKFQVRMSRGTAWGNYSVQWTDGPKTSEVQEVTNRFEGMGFDGMGDSTYYMDKAIEWKGRTVLSGCGMILESREISDEVMAQALAAIELEGFSGSELDMNCAARMVANGESVSGAAAWHNLVR